MGLLWLLTFSAPAQTPSRLELLEGTYQANLKSLHAPVLQDYLRQLELVRSQLIARNRASDARYVEAEIAKVKTIASTTGVLPYTELEAALMPAESKPTSAPAAAPAQSTPAVLPTLLAAEAFKGDIVSSKTGAIPLGSAEWRLYSLPAGTYDVLIIFASESLSLPEAVTINLGGHEYKAAIPTDRATGSPESFRLLKLSRITVDTDVKNSTLALTAASTGKPLLWVKKIMFTAPKKSSS